VFENRVLRWIFGPKRDEVTGEWRKLHSVELHDLYSSPTNVWVMKSRRMRWARHVTRMREGRVVYRVLVGKPEERDHWWDPGVVGRIILRWISRKWNVGVWTGLSWLHLNIIYVWVSPMSSYCQVSPPTPCARLSPPPYAPHAPPISFFSILPPAQCWVRNQMFIKEKKTFNSVLV
jgi:hypothetical protein